MRTPGLSFACLLLTAAASATWAATPVDCWKLSKHGQRVEARRCFEALTESHQAYARAEGFWGLEQWQAANEQFREATSSPDSSPLYKVRWGTLLQERFNSKEAADLFQEVLAKQPDNAAAYLGLATVSASGFDGKATQYVAKAIALDPKLAAVHELMANLALENDDRAVAAEEADKALLLEADALDAMAVHAALELIADRDAGGWFTKIAAVNPHDGEGYARVAHHLELHYRFADAAQYYRKAVAADPQLWAAHSALGIELMRLGETDEPRKELELSYNHEYRDRATTNSLKLLDSYKDFETTRFEAAGTPVALKLGKAEGDLLRPYLEAEMKTILQTYEAKYRMKLAGPVQVELYPNHEDFAVRTMGMPGLGALGVTFDQVIAMDSPSARKPGDFNWGSTLWHEMSHAFIIAATRGRVPRWFTEGLAVHEEGERAPEWRNRLTPEVLLAIRDKKLLPISTLDRGFMYPEYPSQIVVSYFQAGSLCDFVKAKWGEAKLLDMVHAFADLKTTPQVVEATLGVAPEAFDKQYLAWIAKQYGAEAASFDSWRAGLKGLAAATEAKQANTVIAQGPALLAMYPQYVGDASVYEMLAGAYNAAGDSAAEAKTLLAYEHEGGEAPAMLKRLAQLQEGAGDTKAATSTLAQVNYVYPVNDVELHQNMGDLLYADKQYDGALREYTAVLAAHPLDKAGAQFHLAQAFLGAGQRDKAEESVLSALEAAPDYRPAQKLLLELNQAPPHKN